MISVKSRPVEVRNTREGRAYLRLELGDRSGTVEARMWDQFEAVAKDINRDDFVKVKGLMQLYNNRPQLTIHKLRRVEDHEVDFRDFFPASRNDPAAMWTELRVSKPCARTRIRCSTPC